jgi:hypothetical protein
VGLGPETLEKLELALREYGYRTDPYIDALRELAMRQKDGNFDITGIAPEIMKHLIKKGWVDAIGEVTPAGKYLIKK